ncbi:MAG: photosystem I reaction center subunit VIII [Pseudanabaenaceae cyanobacterium bins.39]|nr:photosystem I reaction center subunit VIII [Pseudanabaenaceae cyanobacterium bins.39]
MTGYYTASYISYILVPLIGIILPIATMGLLLNYIEN